jgi:methylenetetrahydrofolate reductase (NADPH)
MMSILSRRRSPVDPHAREALLGLLAEPKFELIPLKSALAQAELLPAGSLVSVTSSPARGIEATVELCENLAARGFRAVPHLAARSIRDRAHLAGLLRRLDGAGVDRAFVVAGDGADAGEFPDGLSLLREIAELGHEFGEVGIPCYPEGHPSIPTERLLEALSAKAPFVHYMTTQLCLDTGAIASWLTDRRAAGIALPVYIGIPGPVEIHKLVTMIARIGVTDSRRFLAKNAGLAGRMLLQPRGFRPDGLLQGVAALAADPGAAVLGLHLYTFNEVEATEAWRLRYLRIHAAGAA